MEFGELSVVVYMVLAHFFKFAMLLAVLVLPIYWLAKLFGRI